MEQVGHGCENQDWERKGRNTEPLKAFLSLSLSPLPLCLPSSLTVSHGIPHPNLQSWLTAQLSSQGAGLLNPGLVLCICTYISLFLDPRPPTVGGSLDASPCGLQQVRGKQVSIA